MRYYPVTKKWKRIKLLIEREDVQKVLVEDFNKFTIGRYGQNFTHGMKPRDFESCDWDWEIKGRRPEYWNYVKHAACHWLVNFNLILAKSVEPNRQWRIVTSQKHSTVWDGDETLFDMNFLALQVDANEAKRLASTKGRMLPIGKSLRVYFAEGWQAQKDNNQKK